VNCRVFQERGHDFDVYCLESEDGLTKASVVPELGGIVSSLVVPFMGQSRQLLYQHDHFWVRENERIRGGSPFLFPICGRLLRGGEKGVYLYKGKRYELPSHGFAPHLPWEVVECDRALLLRLRDNEQTRSCYPFQFEVDLRYTVSDGVLLCEQSYKNMGDEPLPFYAGFHPYILTPEGAEKERVILDYAPVRRFLYNDSYTDVVDSSEPPELPASITDETLNEQLTSVKEDNHATLLLPDGLCIHLEAAGAEDENMFPYVQLYTMSDKPFFCVEPWMAPPNTMNTVAGCRWLAPGQTEHGTFRLWVTEKRS